LLETLPPDGYFYPNEWLYEQMSLAVPQRQLCDRNCPGILVSSTLDSSDSPETPMDNRWASLEALKKRLPG
ncbi:MAG: YceD family protein, partial [Nostoc sp.]